MSHDYQDWVHLNEEGMKDWGHIFIDGVVPILSMIPITFESPNLSSPETGYLVRGSDLTEDQVQNLVDKIAHKFNEAHKDEIKKYIQANELPLRQKMTSGVGTKRIYAYIDEDLMDDEGYEDEDWDNEPYDDEVDWSDL